MENLLKKTNKWIITTNEYEFVIKVEKKTINIEVFRINHSIKELMITDTVNSFEKAKYFILSIINSKNKKEKNSTHFLHI